MNDNRGTRPIGDDIADGIWRWLCRPENEMQRKSLIAFVHSYKRYSSLGSAPDAHLARHVAGLLLNLQLSLYDKMGADTWIDDPLPHYTFACGFSTLQGRIGAGRYDSQDKDDR